MLINSPAQPANLVPEESIKLLYDKLIYICQFVEKVEGNVHALPRDWLMLYRWGKRIKGVKQKTAEGYTVEHVTVGGRTSSFIPELQKLSKSGVAKSSKRSSAKITEDEEPKAAVKKESAPKKTTVKKTTIARTVEATSSNDVKSRNKRTKITVKKEELVQASIEGGSRAARAQARAARYIE